MLGFFEIFVIAFGLLLGGVPTLYLIWETGVTLTQKLYRKMKYGISMFN